jgi:hypothetical protein
MRERKFKREMRKAAKLELNDLHKEAQRNKRLLRNALACRFRDAYIMRRQLGRAYGREIARRLSAK